MPVLATGIVVDIDSGHLVLAKAESRWPAWWEAIVVENADDLFKLRWRDNASAPQITRPRLDLQLWFLVLVAMGVGVVLGHFYPQRSGAGLRMIRQALCSQLFLAALFRYSPMTFTITRLSRCPSNSAQKIHCHVPRSSLPLVIGTGTS
jgi:hypothetical protein